MNDRLVFAMVVIAAIEFLFLVLPILIRTLWHVRDIRGLGLAILIKLIVGDIWMILFLGTLSINRLFNRGPMNDIIVFILALVLVARPTAYYIYYRYWLHRIWKGNHE